ncbi:hypothetical protein BH10ACI2_BH10ACI2_20310 [soil metagenome]
MLQAVHHVQISIPVGSEDEARAFYCGVLGLNEISKPDILKGRGGFWLDLDGFQIHFGTEDGIDRAKTRSHVAFLVEDLDKCRANLTASGFKTLESIPIPNLNRFEFRDPFGNRIEMLEKID